MFCPVCKSEYRKGFKKCADCGIPLVEELPQASEGKQKPDPDPNLPGFVEVMYTFNPGDIAMIESLLVAEGVTYFFSYPSYGADELIPAKLMVKEDQAEMAVELLKQLKLAINVINLSRTAENSDGDS